MRTLIPLALAFAATTLAGCGTVVRGIADGGAELRQAQWLVQGRRGPLTETEKAWAQIAWQYVSLNTNDSTGLVPGSDRGQRVTLWDVADTLAALLAANALGIIDDAQYDQRVSPLLHFLNRAPLLRGQLPNLYYAVADGAMLGRDERPGEAGWSTLDLGRLLIWLRLTGLHKPYLSEYTEKVVQRWDLCALRDDSPALLSARISGGKLERYDAERIGWREYARAGFVSWGIVPADGSTDAEPAPSAAMAYVDGVPIEHDARDPRASGERDTVPATPYLYAGLEFNWDRIDTPDGLETTHGDQVLARRARAIHEAGVARHAAEHLPPARARHRSDKAGGIVDDGVYGQGYGWNTLSESGQYAPDSALVSTGAGFAIWALWRSDYSDHVLEDVQHVHDRKRGWLEGRLERTGGHDKAISLATQALVLTSLWYKRSGPVWPVAAAAPPIQRRDPVLGSPHCQPLAPAVCTGDSRCRAQP